MQKWKLSFHIFMVDVKAAPLAMHGLLQSWGVFSEDTPHVAGVGKLA